MKKRVFIILTALLFLLYINSCKPGTSSNSNSIATDSATIAAGEQSCNLNCSGCHNFRQDGIGPRLSGLTNEVSADWIKHFIKDPQQIINSGDERAKELYKKYKAGMPAFNGLKDDEIYNIIAFIHTHKPIQTTKENGNALSNPIPEPIQVSDLSIGLQLITQIPASSD